MMHKCIMGKVEGNKENKLNKKRKYIIFCKNREEIYKLRFCRNSGTMQYASLA